MLTITDYCVKCGMKRWTYPTSDEPIAYPMECPVCHVESIIPRGYEYEYQDVVDEHREQVQ